MTALAINNEYIERAAFASESSALAQAQEKSRSEALTALFAALGRQFVVYHPKLALVLGSAKAALMLGHALYYTRQLNKSRPEREGWFYMAAEDWFKATGLCLREQASARKTLKKLGVLNEKRIGMPARLWYQIDIEKLGLLLGAQLGDSRGNCIEDAALSLLLGRTIIYYAPLAWYLDSAVAAIALSQLINYYRFRCKSGHDDVDGWVYAPGDESWKAVCIGQSPVRGVRERAASEKIIEFKRSRRRGGALLYRLDSELMLQVFEGLQFEAFNKPNSKINAVGAPAQKLRSLQADFFAPKPDASTEAKIAPFNDQPKSAEQSGALLAPKNEVDTLLKTQIKRRAFNKVSDTKRLSLNPYFVKTETPVLRIQQSIDSKATPYFVKNANQDLRFSQNPIKVLNNTQYSYSNTSSVKKKVGDSILNGGVGGVELIYPVDTTEDDMLVIKNLFARYQLKDAVDQQRLLDELSGQLEISIKNQRPINSPVAYLATLIYKFTQGTLIFIHAEKIKKIRDQELTAKLVTPGEESNGGLIKSPEQIEEEKIKANKAAEAKEKVRAMLIQYGRRKAGAA